MAKSLRFVALLAFIVSGAHAAKAQSSDLSADDTAAYINATLHKYPTLEFVDAGCPGDEQTISISGDRRSLIIKQTFGKSAQGKCDNVQTLTVPVFSLSRDGLGSWSKQGQHSSFFLDCINRVDCFSRRSDGAVFTSAENHWHLQMTAPDEISRRLRKAVQHLLDSLLLESTARIDGNDAFAKRTR